MIFIILQAENEREIFYRQWSRKRSYVMQWKQCGNSCFCDRVSAVGGCEAGVTARTRCGRA